MIRTRFVHCALLFLFLASCPAQQLRVATVNVWSGLDYKLGWHTGEWQSDSVRALRMHMLADELQARHIDVVAIQEANPAGAYAAALADALGFDEVHQYVNGGIKLFCIGYPMNLNEGIAILAHPRLNLRKKESVRISGPFGLHSRGFSLQTGENNFALIAKITVDGIPVLLVNVHLKAALPLSMLDTVAAWCASGRMTQDEADAAARQITSEAGERDETFRAFTEEHIAPFGTVPLILLGDFNAEPGSNEIRTALSQGMRDVGAVLSGPTWDPALNTNIAYSTAGRYADGSPAALLDRIGSAYDNVPRRIDYILLNGCLAQAPVASVDRIGTEPRTASDTAAQKPPVLFASDHYGVAAAITLSGFTSPVTRENDHVATAAPDYDVFAFPSYDSDTGIGAGIKCFLLNQCGWNESVDVTAYASAKNERWFNAVVSLPDLETRQGKRYPIALDIAFDYDKYVKANFFPGYDNGSDAGMETYTREPVDVSATFSRGFSPTFVASLTLRYKTVSTYGFDAGRRFAAATPGSAMNVRSLSSTTLRVRYDTRDSYVNPRSGIVAMAEMEVGQYYSDYYESLNRIGAGLQCYTELFSPGVVGALRVTGQLERCDNSPLWMWIPLGGTTSLRGFAMDRFLGKMMLLANTEVRYPLYKRLGGVVFADAGTVAGSADYFKLTAFHVAPGFGLRLMFDTFVVRADIGFSSEGGGLYLNFGHMF